MSSEPSELSPVPDDLQAQLWNGCAEEHRVLECAGNQLEPADCDLEGLDFEFLMQNGQQSDESDNDPTDSDPPRERVRPPQPQPRQGGGGTSGSNKTPCAPRSKAAVASKAIPAARFFGRAAASASAARSRRPLAVVMTASTVTACPRISDHLPPAECAAAAQTADAPWRDFMPYHEDENTLVTISMGQWLALQQELRLKDFLIFQLERQLNFERGCDGWFESNSWVREQREEQLHTYTEGNSGGEDNADAQARAGMAVDEYENEDERAEHLLRQRSAGWWDGEAETVRRQYEGMEHQCSMDQAKLGEDEREEYNWHMKYLVEEMVDSFKTRRETQERSQETRITTWRQHHDRVRQRHLQTVWKPLLGFYGEDADTPLGSDGFDGALLGQFYENHGSDEGSLSDYISVASTSVDSRRASSDSSSDSASSSRPSTPSSSPRSCRSAHEAVGGGLGNSSSNQGELDGSKGPGTA
eukprot:TRINITY_DN35685_c0_g1_i1.p1 TRINITY_DN35685_c0_g1~~TRINITY_DN35685_c0_g1_i1.p1  ORF type:complete len:472 (+),score=99.45 TRINITY_DN35685_c0_g1_i1:103-1518(+)